MIIRRPTRVRDLSNKRFHKLIVLSVSGRDKNNRAIWLCKCDCGNEVNVRSRNLVHNQVTSCGCHGKLISSLNGKKSAYKISGKNSYLYNHNMTDEERLEKRIDSLINEWRIKVFERDNYTCDICKIKGCRLNAHHLNCHKHYKDLRYDINNGITLCKNCHKEFHVFMGGPTSSCNKEDYIRYKKLKFSV